MLFLSSTAVAFLRQGNCVNSYLQKWRTEGQNSTGPNCLRPLEPLAPVLVSGWSGGPGGAQIEFRTSPLGRREAVQEWVIPGPGYCYICVMCEKQGCDPLSSVLNLSLRHGIRRGLHASRIVSLSNWHAQRGKKKYIGFISGMNAVQRCRPIHLLLLLCFTIPTGQHNENYPHELDIV